MFLGESAAMDKEKVGILFIMSIDPKIVSTPFADVEKVSFFQREAEILFSMHTVFRIETIQALTEERRHFAVNLTLTTDDDIELSTLMKGLADYVHASNGWERIGKLLITVGQPKKAEELYHTLLDQTSNLADQGHYYYQLGRIKNDQGDYKEAIRYYENAI